MKLVVYNFLVNRHSGIRQKYHNYHDRAHGYKNILSWFYLIVLNIICLFTLGRYPGKTGSEQNNKHKRLPLDMSESMVRVNKYQNVDEMYKELVQFDVISFDIFDTLIFRPFSEPTDLFYLIGDQIGILDFNRMRQNAEYNARIENFSSKGTYEV